MSPALEQLVREAIAVTGSEQPDLLEDDSPVLTDDALKDGEGDFYLIGLIGGKDVGKSALINALVGKAITAVTSHGAGTEIVIAYAHASQEPALRKLLESEVPGEFRIVKHDIDALRRQVLLDLPDIDSRYASHLIVTRKMLRRMLYPVWVGSIEKYADQQPQSMLGRVAEGNTPANFVFCLNKVDQLKNARTAEARKAVVAAHEAEEAAVHVDPDRPIPMPWGLDDEPSHLGSKSLMLKHELSSILDAKVDSGLSDPLDEIRADYAARIARTLKLPTPPRVYLISARMPAGYEFPALRDLLSREKSADIVRESKHLAAARQDLALLTWLDAQELPKRAERLGQLRHDAEELVADRVAGPLLDRIVPRLLDDPSTRFAMADDILQERVAGWPIVNLVHTLLQPIFVLLRSAVSRGAAPMQGAEAMVDAVIRDSGESIGKRVQSAFAYLRQSQPAVAPLYEQNKLWEDMPSDLAGVNLKTVLADTVHRQRAAARENLGRSSAVLGAPVRWLLTIGALLWFPFIQPILSALLAAADPHTYALTIHWPEVGRLIVLVLGVDYLLKSAGFLIIYYATLWLALRWNTQRKVARLMSRWRDADFPDPALNLGSQTLRWMDDLIAPITTAQERMQSIADRVTALRAAATQSN